MAGKFFPIETYNLGSATSIATFNDATLPLATALGSVIEQDGKIYRLVQFNNGAGNVASVAGGRAIWKTRASNLVTMDVTDAEAGGTNDTAGGFLGVVTDLSYCYIQIGGLQTLQGDGSVAAGELVSGGSTTDGEFDTWATTEHAVAIAWADDAGSPATFPAYWLFGNLL